MGNIKHRSIIVHTSSSRGEKPIADRVQSFIDDIELGHTSFEPQNCILVTPPLINGEVTIVLAPSGSKCGWEDDRQWLVLCGEFIAWCRRALLWADMVCIDDLGDDRPNDGRPRHSLVEANLFAGHEISELEEFHVEPSADVPRGTRS